MLNCAVCYHFRVGIQHLYTVSYLWYPAIGATTTVVIGLIVSFITGKGAVEQAVSIDRIEGEVRGSRTTSETNNSFPGLIEKVPMITTDVSLHTSYAAYNVT